MGRPPWQAHVFAGVAGGRFAILVKLHHALADAAGAWALAGALLDGDVGTLVPQRTTPGDDHAPMMGSWPERVLRGPQWIRRELTTLAGAVGDHAGKATRLGEIATATASALRPGASRSPLTTLRGGTFRRQTSLVRVPTEPLHRARRQVGGTLNDSVLAIIAGGIDRWLRHTDAEALASGWRPRAFVPVSLRHRCRGSIAAGNQLSGYLCDLPVGEPDPLARVHSVRASMHRNKSRGPYRGPGAFPLLADALPASAHRLASAPRCCSIP